MNPTIKARIESIRRGEVPEGYKRTKIGIVPNEWGISKIGATSKSIIPGATPSTSVKEYWDGDIRWMSSGEIHNRFIYDTKIKISKEGYDACSTTMLPAHCVLVALAGQGKTRGCVAVNEVELCTNQSIAAVVPKDIYYLYSFFFLESKYLELRKISSGDGTRGGLNISLLNAFQIAIPTNFEQEKIAEILMGQDRVIELKEKLLAEKQKQKKYLMQQLLTGKKRLPGFSCEWRIVKLKEVLKERDEKNVAQNLEICSVAVQKGVINQIEHLGRSFAASDTSNYNVVLFGDIVYTKSPTGEFPFGIIKQSQLDKAAVSPLYGVFKPITYALGYILHCYFEIPINTNNYLNPIIQKGAKNTINISNSTFLSNKLLLPMDEKEQTAIAEILSEADKEIELLKKDIEQEKLKKKSLMQLLLTGIVRVDELVS